jgi:hypothetical protein
VTQAERLLGTLASHYAGVAVGGFAASDHACAFTTSQPLQDPDTKGFRSSAPPLNELAVAHRLSLAFARGAFGLGPDSGFAIKHLASQSAGSAHPGPDHYKLERRSSPGQRRGATELGATLTRRSPGVYHETELVFTVMPAALVHFVRQTRGFAGYSDVAVDGTGLHARPGPAGEREYSPREADRWLDGARTDHVPALVLIDIIMATFLHDRPPPRLQVQFARYIDPRIPFTMRPGGAEAVVMVEQPAHASALLRRGMER